MHTKISGELSALKRWLRGSLSAPPEPQGDHTQLKISSVYVIKKLWLRTNLAQLTHTKIGGECII